MELIELIRHPSIRASREVLQERNRQEILKKQGRFLHTCADPELSHYDRFVILSEEIGEVAREIQAKDDVALKRELTQMAAICIAWLEVWYD